jgi:hypothetical protein
MKATCWISSTRRRAFDPGPPPPKKVADYEVINAVTGLIADECSAISGHDPRNFSAESETVRSLCDGKVDVEPNVDDPPMGVRLQVHDCTGGVQRQTYE